MILTDYYKMKRLPEFDKNKTPRYDCILSVGAYPAFEAIKKRSRVKRFFFHYVNVPERFDANVKRKTDKAITNGDNISSVFMLDVESGVGFGDCKGSQDALLFLFSLDYTTVEIYVARGQKNNRASLCNLFADGELDEEIAELQKRAVTESVTNKEEADTKAVTESVTRTTKEPDKKE